MGLESKPGLVHQVVEQSSHRFMCEHHSKFDDHKIVQELDRIRGVKREGKCELVGKVRKSALDLADDQYHVFGFLLFVFCGHCDSWRPGV